MRLDAAGRWAGAGGQSKGGRGGKLGARGAGLLCPQRPWTYQQDSQSDLLPPTGWPLQQPPRGPFPVLLPRPGSSGVPRKVSGGWG